MLHADHSFIKCISLIEAIVQLWMKERYRVGIVGTIDKCQHMTVLEAVLTLEEYHSWGGSRLSGFYPNRLVNIIQSVDRLLLN